MNKQVLEDLQAELDSRGEFGRVDTRSRLIVHDENSIYIYLKESGQTEYACYTPELYYLLSCPCYCSYSYDYQQERAKVEVGISLFRDHNRIKINLGRMLLLWYENDLCVEDFVSTFPKIKNMSDETDHLNSDKHNHCKWNLSKVAPGENGKKNALASHIKPPYFCYFAITNDKKYRVCFGYKTAFHWGQIMYIQFSSLESLTDFIKSTMEMTKVAAFVKKYGTPKKLYKANPKATYAAENFQVAAQYARLLLSMNNDDFVKWETSSKITVR